MTQNKFTPGPWQYWTGSLSRSPGIYGPRVPNKDRNWIADIRVGDPKVQEANAQLIAAAPEMYEALEWLLPIAETYLRLAPNHPDNAKVESARFALRKARGEK
jgi:hypothetical protein